MLTDRHTDKLCDDDTGGAFVRILGRMPISIGGWVVNLGKLPVSTTFSNQLVHHVFKLFLGGF